jgi:hypothetical protein
MASSYGPAVDYTNRTRDDMIEAAKARIRTFLPEWTDHGDNDIGIAIIEAIADMVDGLHFYIDRTALERFLEPARYRKSVGDNVKLIDYYLQSATPSTTEVNFSLDSVATADITVPKGTVLSTSSSTPLSFETIREFTVPSGDTTYDGVSVVQGLTTIRTLAVSDGSAYQTRELPDTNIIDDTLRVFVNEGVLVEWEVLESLENSDPEDKAVEYERDAYGNYTLRFGEGSNGKIPIAGSTIQVQYRIGGGANTNVGVGSIDTVVSTIADDLGNPVQFTVMNPVEATGGANRQTLSDAKRQAPRHLRALYRGVTGGDIETLANDISGVLKTKAVHGGYNTIIVYVVPSGGGTPSNSLLASVENYFNVETGVMCFNHIALAASYVEIELTATVHVLDNYKQDTTQSSVESELDDFFDLVSLEFGQDIRISDIYALVENINGVEYIELGRLTLTPEPSYDTWSGDSTIDGISITSATVAETWTTYFTSPTSFTVTGSVSGFQGTGTVDVAFTSSDNKISFTINSGSAPNSVADVATIRVSPIKDTVLIEDGEIAIEQTGGFSLTFEGGIEI